MEDLPVVLGVTFMAAIVALLIGWTVWILSRRGQERIRGQLDLQRRTLERMTSAQELTAFIETESGRRFLDSLSTDHAAHVQRVLSSTRLGILLVLLGTGLCALPLFNDDLWPLATFGLLAILLGAGFLISAWVSYRLARGWGLLPPST